jgi:RHS repeat-associated protein
MRSQRTHDPASLPQKKYSYLYDNYKRFPTTVTNPNSQNIQTTYSSLWGKPLTIMGYDGLTVKHTYDAFGRELSCSTPDNITTNYSYDWVAQGEVVGDPSQIPIPTIPFKITSTKPGVPTTVKYYDILGRNVRTKTDGLQNPFYSFTTFDTQGHVALSTSYYEMGNPKPIFNIFTYDEFGQIKNTEKTDYSTSYNTGYVYAYSTTNNDATVTITPPDGNSYKEVFDASGLKSAAIDNNGIIMNYAYNAQHQPTQVTLGSSNILATITYDEYGRQQSIFEPNSGTTTYEYSAYDLLYTQTDFQGNQYTYTYDVLDRLIKKTNGTDNYSYSYVGTGNGINQLQTRSGPNNSITTDYSYDALNRVTQITESTNGGLSTAYEYDQYNNISKITYPGNFAITRSYTSNGYLNSVNRADNGNLIWQSNKVNPMGLYTQFTLGNGVSTTKTYDNYGYPLTFIANKGSTTIQNLGFTFDQTNGNLKNRKDAFNSGNILNESFTYDNLNRLWTITDPSNAVMTMQYATNGNITVKPDVGTYTYNSPQQNQVLTVSNPNGSISLNTQTIDYNSFKKPYNILETDINSSLPLNQLSLIYGPEQQRRETNLTTANGSTTTYYSLNYEKQIVANSNATTEINYITGGDGLCAMFVKSPNDNGKMYYVYTDHLGSILTLTDDQGAVYARQSFDAWGQPRDPDTWAQYNENNPFPNNTPNWLIRGFTGHENLPQFDLVNMNGRLYEPLTGRMKSVDDHLSDDGDAQAYNKYSYCNNNPLKSIDPSGEDPEAFLAIFAFVVGGIADVAQNWDHIMHAKSSTEAGLEYFAAGGTGALVGVLSGNPYAGAAVGAALTIGVDALGGIGPGGPGGTNVLNKSSSTEEWVQAGVSGATSALEGEIATDEFAESAFEDDPIRSSTGKLGSGPWKSFSKVFTEDGSALKFVSRTTLGVLQDYGKNKFNFSKNFSIAQLATSITTNTLKSVLDDDKVGIKNTEVGEDGLNIYTIPGLASRNYLRSVAINGIANYGGNIIGGLFKTQTYSSTQDFSNSFLVPIPSAFGFTGDNYSFGTDDAIDSSIDALQFYFFIFR